MQSEGSTASASAVHTAQGVRGRGHELWLDAANGRIQVPEVLHRMKHKSIEAALAYAPDPALAAEAIHKYNQGTRKPLPSVRRH